MCPKHDPPVSGPPAELATRIGFSGQSVFTCEVMVENPLGHGVTFELAFDDAPADRPIRIDIAAGERRHWTVPLGALHGPKRVRLRTQMAAGSPTNHQNRAYWLEPRFT